MAIRILFWGIDERFESLKPYYANQLNDAEIVGYAEAKDNKYYIYQQPDKKSNISKHLTFDYIILSSYFPYKKMMEIKQYIDFPNERMLDGRIFSIPGFSFARFLETGRCDGRLSSAINERFFDYTCPFLTRVYAYKDLKRITLGKKSYVIDSAVEWNFQNSGEIVIGNFTSIAAGAVFMLGRNNCHNYHRVYTFDNFWFDWNGEDIHPSQRQFCRIVIGSDVWIGRGVQINSANPNKALTVGNGAVIAAHSYIVEDVPPYAIVGGNPARIIKYRFAPEIIAKLEKIAWWNWDQDDIYARFSSMGNPTDFLQAMSSQDNDKRDT